MISARRCCAGTALVVTKACLRLPLLRMAAGAGCLEDCSNTTRHGSTPQEGSPRRAAREGIAAKGSPISSIPAAFAHRSRERCSCAMRASPLNAGGSLRQRTHELGRHQSGITPQIAHSKRPAARRRQLAQRAELTCSTEVVGGECSAGCLKQLSEGNHKQV